ncbi:hypothetical protein [Desulfobulbus alkaliphilus]|nr:hypothetical protein [Desulfobulbus alkaliphilus]MBM9535824.1 hypothetical protein [Desulfobulbus alkaliphilus]
MDYTTSHFTQKVNFCRVDLDWGNRRMEVRFFGYDSKELTRTAVLELA